MTSLFNKLNPGTHACVCVLDAPDAFEPALAGAGAARLRAVNIGR